MCLCVHKTCSRKNSNLYSVEDDVGQGLPWNELASPPGGRRSGPTGGLLPGPDDLHHPLWEGERLSHHGRQGLCHLPCILHGTP